MLARMRCRKICSGTTIRLRCEIVLSHSPAQPAAFNGGSVMCRFEPTPALPAHSSDGSKPTHVAMAKHSPLTLGRVFTVHLFSDALENARNVRRTIYLLRPIWEER